MAVPPPPPADAVAFGIPLAPELPLVTPLGSIRDGAAVRFPELRVSVVRAAGLAMEADAYEPVYRPAAPGANGRRTITLLAGESGYALQLGDQARYAMGNAAIAAVAAADYPDWSLEIDLMGIVLALWQELHGVPVLHGAAVAGKTTLALECLARGATLLADDAVALEPAGSSTLAWPAFPCVRAWRADALRRGLSVADAPPVHPLVDKVRIPVGRGGPFAAARGPRPVVRCFLVRPAPAGEPPLAVAPVPPSQALIELLRYGSAPNLAEHLPTAAARLRALALLLSHAPLLELRVGRGDAGIEAAADTILKSIR